MGLRGWCIGVVWVLVGIRYGYGNGLLVLGGTSQLKDARAWVVVRMVMVVRGR